MKISRRKRNSIYFILLCAIILAVWTVWGNKALMVNVITVSGNRIPAAFSGFRIAPVPQHITIEMGCAIYPVI